MRHAGSVQRQERLTSWLFQVTRNAIVDYYRAPERRRVLPSGTANELEAMGPHAWDGGDDNALDSRAAMTELAACIGPMVRQLPPLYREAVMLIDLEDLPQREAAARAGLSVSGRKSRVQRGRQALKDRLQACCRIDLDASGRFTDYQLPATGCGPCTNGCGPDESV